MLTVDGIYIASVRFVEPVDLSGIKLDWPLILEDVQFESGLSLVRLHAAPNAFVEVSTWSPSMEVALNASSATIGSDLILNRSHFAQIDLRHAKIGGTLTVSGGQIGNLQMDSTSIGGHFHACNSRFGNVDLRGLKVLGHLNMTNSVVDDLTMDWSTIGGNLFLQAGLCEIVARRSDFSKMRPATYANVDMSFSKIGGNVDLSGGEFACLRMMGTTVNGELTLENSGDSIGTIWPVVGGRCPTSAVQEGDEVWPSNLELEGLSYGRIRGNSDHISHYLGWLSSDTSFSLEPYMELASVLRKAGLSSEADDVLFAGRMAGMQNSSGGYWVGSQLLRITIGFGIGYRIFRVVLHFVGLVVVGTIVLFTCLMRARLSPRTCHHRATGGETPRGKTRLVGSDFLRSFWYSLDYALPVIKLDETHFGPGNIGDSVKQYFYIHQILGYLLIFFAILGLTGVVQ